MNGEVIRFCLFAARFALALTVGSGVGSASPDTAFIVEKGVASARERGLYRFDGDGSSVLIKAPVPAWVRSVAAVHTSSETTFLVASDSGLFHWELQRNEFDTVIPPIGISPPKMIAVIPGDDALIAVGRPENGRSRNVTTARISLPDLTWTPLPSEGIRDVDALTFCPNGELFGFRMRDGIGSGSVASLPKFNQSGTQVSLLTLSQSIPADGKYRNSFGSFESQSTVQIKCDDRFLFLLRQPGPKAILPAQLYRIDRQTGEVRTVFPEVLPNPVVEIWPGSPLGPQPSLDVRGSCENGPLSHYVTPKELVQSAATDVHVVSMQQSKKISEPGPDTGRKFSVEEILRRAKDRAASDAWRPRTSIRVARSERPVELVLSTIEKSFIRIELEKGAELTRVTVLGNADTVIEGVPGTATLVHLNELASIPTRWESPVHQPSEFAPSIRALRALLGKQESSFQGCERMSAITVPPPSGEPSSFADLVNVREWQRMKSGLLKEGELKGEVSDGRAENGDRSKPAESGPPAGDSPIGALPTTGPTVLGLGDGGWQRATLIEFGETGPRLETAKETRLPLLGVAHDPSSGKTYAITESELGVLSQDGQALTEPVRIPELFRFSDIVLDEKLRRLYLSSDRGDIGVYDLSSKTTDIRRADSIGASSTTLAWCKDTGRLALIRYDAVLEYNQHGALIARLPLKPPIPQTDAPRMRAYCFPETIVVAKIGGLHAGILPRFFSIARSTGAVTEITPDRRPPSSDEAHSGDRARGGNPDSQEFPPVARSPECVSSFGPSPRIRTYEARTQSGPGDGQSLEAPGEELHILNIQSGEPEIVLGPTEKQPVLLLSSQQTVKWKLTLMPGAQHPRVYILGPLSSCEGPCEHVTQLYNERPLDPSPLGGRVPGAPDALKSVRAALGLRERTYQECDVGVRFFIGTSISPASEGKLR